MSIDNLDKRYGLPETVFGSFLKQASYLRNLCAHHNRVWNRDFTFLFELPQKQPNVLVGNFDASTDSGGNPQNRKVYNTLVMLVYLMNIVSEGSSWGQRLMQLLNENEERTSEMGFPTKWKERQIWQDLVT
jgi:abortive infection bacteriophage resistance protein